MRRRRVDPAQQKAARSRPYRTALQAGVAEHVERYLGPVTGVVTGFGSGPMRVDLIWVEPRPGQDFHTLVTSGMSARPMSKPAGPCECSPFAELVLRLPAHWPVGPGAGQARKFRWPLEELIYLAHMPHRDETHFGLGHTVTLVEDTGEAVASITPETTFGGWVLRRPDWAPRPFRHLRRTFLHRVDFFSAVPLYPDELKLAFDEGSQALFERLDASGITDLLVADRPSAFTVLH